MAKRGKFVGENCGNPPTGEAEHFYRCARCNQWVDKRDTTQVYDHMRPLPHLTEGREN